MKPRPTVNISVAIPTFNRERVLVETIDFLLALNPGPAEILVLDQTTQHLAETSARLAALDASGQIRWLRLTEPSIPRAMNQGLLNATQPIVMFVDDDIRPEPNLLAAHAEAHARHEDIMVAGRVIQPWQEGVEFSATGAFHFACLRQGWITEFMGGNFSLPRAAALDLGGFDENFVKVAYRFEAEFSHRFLRSGRRIWFEPAACLHHLKDSGGGTRTYGNHLTTWRPDHAVGAYYFGLRTRRWREIAARPLRSVSTRHHMRRPWQIPGTLLAEVRGLIWALRLHASGPRYVTASESVVR